MNEHLSSSADHASAQAPAGGGQAATIDIAKLAEKVYQLLREEARLARARGQVRARRR